MEGLLSQGLCKASLHPSHPHFKGGYGSLTCAYRAPGALAGAELGSWPAGSLGKEGEAGVVGQVRAPGSRKARLDSWPQWSSRGCHLPVSIAQGEEGVVSQHLLPRQDPPHRATEGLHVKEEAGQEAAFRGRWRLPQEEDADEGRKGAFDSRHVCGIEYD